MRNNHRFVVLPEFHVRSLLKDNGETFGFQSRDDLSAVRFRV